MQEQIFKYIDDVKTQKKQVKENNKIFTDLKNSVSSSASHLPIQFELIRQLLNENIQKQNLQNLSLQEQIEDNKSMTLQKIEEKDNCMSLLGDGFQEILDDHQKSLQENKDLKNTIKGLDNHFQIQQKNQNKIVEETMFLKDEIKKQKEKVISLQTIVEQMQLGCQSTENKMQILEEENLVLKNNIEQQIKENVQTQNQDVNNKKSIIEQSLSNFQQLSQQIQFIYENQNLQQKQQQRLTTQLQVSKIVKLQEFKTMVSSGLVEDVTLNLKTSDFDVNDTVQIISILIKRETTIKGLTVNFGGQGDFRIQFRVYKNLKLDDCISNSITSQFYNLGDANLQPTLTINNVLYISTKTPQFVRMIYVQNFAKVIGRNIVINSNTKYGFYCHKCKDVELDNISVSNSLNNGTTFKNCDSILIKDSNFYNCGIACYFINSNGRLQNSVIRSCKQNVEKVNSQVQQDEHCVIFN
eukprot:TRINITY_DN2323_c0_g1_i13.p1 TRINITY_DN2323_c0_g1~~TRINITY_DN2323_c0_g1_i13.p1  ORF type:complete len:468 (+),score=7.87 TRINITY_DN2323_c0_g1_i13:213-1616(+)